VRHRLHLPDVVAVLANGAIAGELTHPRHIQDRHAGPVLLVPVGLADLVLTIDVGLVIRQQQERIAVQQVIHQRAEQIGVAVGEVPGGHQIQHSSEGIVAVVVVPGVVALRLEGIDLLRFEAKQEEVFGPHLFADFDVGPIQGANGEGSVHGELHVAGAGGFLTSGGNLLRQFRRRIHPLAKGDVVVRQEHHLQAVAAHPGRC
jgi:hypothetical protein